MANILKIKDRGYHMQPAMRPDEVLLFRQFLNSSRSYFEFGMGGSTVLASSLIDGPVTAIDSSNEWIEKVRTELPDGAHERKLVHATIGATGDWGAPIGATNREAFLNYHDLVWNDVNPKAELYFVDGRFRVACFLQILRRMDTDSVIGVHDYRSRPYYHVIEKFGRPIAEASELTFFVKRAKVSERNVLDLLDAFKYNSA